MKQATETITSKDLRKFGVLTGAIVCTFFGLLLPWFFYSSYPVWPWVVAAMLVIPAIIYPPVLRPLYRGWMAFGAVMGWLNSRIILAVMFYLIILPSGLLMRLFGKDPMNTTWDEQIDSYRVKSHVRNKKHFERPF